MAILKLIDDNTGQFVDLDFTTNSGIINIIDSNTGEFFTLDLSDPTGSVSVIDANTGRFVTLNYPTLSGILTTIDPVTGQFISLDLSNPTGSGYITDENTGEHVLVDFAGDTVRPTVTITSTSSGAVVAAFSVTITFSEAVTGFALGDITVGNGSAGNLGGSGAVYTADITPTATGNVTVNVAAGVAADGAGNTNTASNTFTILYLSAFVWFDYSDISTLYQDSGITPVTADGQSIGQANDKSGNARHVVQTTASFKPTYKTNIQNGKSVGRGDGGDMLQKLGAAQAQPLTVFVVASALDSAAAYSLTGEVRTGFTTSNRLFIYAGSFVLSANNAYTNDTKYVLRYEVNGASSAIYKNGLSVVTGNSGANNIANFATFAHEGAGNPLKGDIGEMIVVAGVPNATVAGQIESYLNTKWAVF